MKFAGTLKDYRTGSSEGRWGLGHPHTRLWGSSDGSSHQQRAPMEKLETPDQVSNLYNSAQLGAAFALTLPLQGAEKTGKAKFQGNHSGHWDCVKQTPL